MRDERQRYVASALAKDASAEQRRARERRETVTRSLTPLVSTPARSLNATSPLQRSPSRRGANESQAELAKRHARAWKRMFGRFEDALGGNDEVDDDDDGEDDANVPVPSGANAAAGAGGAAGTRMEPAETDPVVGNESRPVSRPGGARGRRSDKRDALAEPSTIEDFFVTGNFEAVTGDEAADDGMGGAAPDDGGDMTSSSSVTSAGGLSDIREDDSSVSDEGLRRVVDGSTTSSSSSSAASTPSARAANEASVVSLDASGCRVARSEVATDVVKRAFATSDAAVVLQRWARATGLPVARRRRACRERRDASAKIALDEAVTIVRREHAAGTIQRGWRSQYRAV
jgi:hypothetical protein